MMVSEEGCVIWVVASILVPQRHTKPLASLIHKRISSLLCLYNEYCKLHFKLYISYLIHIYIYEIYIYIYFIYIYILIIVIFCQHPLSPGLSQAMLAPPTTLPSARHLSGLPRCKASTTGTWLRTTGLFPADTSASSPLEYSSQSVKHGHCDQ